MLGLIVMTLGWALAAGWAAWDADRRGRSWFTWSRIVFFAGLFGLVFWLVRRRRYTTVAALPAKRSVLLALSGIPLTVISTAAFAFVVVHVVQFAHMEGQSMIPTLHDQDRFFVNKLVYQISAPAKGDIVLMLYPEDPSKSFAKRIIAAEGDVIRSENGQVFINEQPEPDYQIPEEYRSFDSWGPYAVRRGYYFVMGDHRNNSSDSRAWGEVPAKYILGRIKSGRQ